MNIALIDSSTDIESFLKNSKSYSKIITMDYETDKILSSKNITHEISDDFVDYNELEKIQKKSYQFSKWYELDEIKNIISYNGINLGELFYAEFHYFLVPFLKKILEISKIIQKFPLGCFYSSGMSFEIVTQISQNCSSLNSISKNNNFVYDSIKKTFKLGKKEFTINISRSNFKNLKNKSEFLLDKFFHPKKNIVYDTLFVEFDSIKYKKLLTSLSELNMNGLFLGLRHPAIWNPESLSVFRQSKCDIATFNYIMANSDREKAQNDKKTINDFLRELEDFSYFKEFFSLESISFWNIIKDYFLLLCEKRMFEFFSHIIMIEKLLAEYKMKTILIWSEQSPTEKIILQLAKKYKIPVFLLQHGYYYDTRESYEFLDFMGNIPQHSSKIIVWGNIFQNYLKKSGIKDDQIISLGNPFYDEKFLTQQKKLNEKYVLLATSGPVDNIINELRTTTRENYVKIIKEICSIVTKNKKKLIIKLHPWQEEFFPSEIIESIHPDIQIVREGNILDLIEKCEIFITLDISTTILDAFCLEKPVISVAAKNSDWGIPSIFKNDYCQNVTISEFPEILGKVISNQSFRNELIHNGNLFINEYLNNIDKSSISLLEFLKSHPNS